MTAEGRYGLLTDEELMAMSVQGEEHAFSELYDRYAGRLKVYFSQMLWNDQEKAEDMTQDLFLKVIRGSEQFDESRRFSTWIYAMAANMCKNEYRHHEVRKRHALKVEIEWGERTSSNDQGIDSAAFRSSLDDALSELDHAKRSIFILRFKHHLNIKEIAEIMECSEGTVKSRIFYTLKSLSQSLKAFDPKRTS